MDQIAFCPSTFDLFITDDDTTAQGVLFAQPQHAGGAALLAALRRHGWPTQARLVSPKTPGTVRLVSGVLVELIDALPLLSQPPDGSLPQHAPASLLAWQHAARLALDLVATGQVGVRLSPRGGPIRSDQASTTGEMARFALTWTPVLDARDGAMTARHLGMVATLPCTVAYPVSSSQNSVRPSVLRRERLTEAFLTACTDTLVREASRRGAVVRLHNCAAMAWEQRVVRAVGTDRSQCTLDVQTAEGLSRWLRGEHSTRTGLPLTAPMESASPTGWQATESLAHVMQRILHPARRLATALRSGTPAPRSLREPRLPLATPHNTQAAVPGPLSVLWSSRLLSPTQARHAA